MTIDCDVILDALHIISNMSDKPREDQLIDIVEKKMNAAVESYSKKIEADRKVEEITDEDLIEKYYGSFEGVDYGECEEIQSE